MTKPLLLYVTDAEGLGGAEGYLRTLLLHADQSRYRVGLMLPLRPATQPLVDEARRHGVTVEFLDLVHHEGLRPAAVWRAWRTLRRLRPAVVHFVLPSPRRCAEIVLAAALAGVPRRIATFQLVTPVPRFGWLAGALRRLNRRLHYATLHRAIAVSAGNERLLREQYGVPRLLRIPNAVDSAAWLPLERDPALRERWGVPDDAPLLGVVGRLSRQKGHRVLFAALPQVWARHPQARVVLMGRGELEPDLRAAAATLDPAGRIHFAGQQSAMPQALAELDLFVLPSLYEGLSFAVLEAMAARRAIVATAVDGTIEALEPDRSGLLVPPDDPDALAAALNRLLDDPGLRASLGAAASARVAECFDQSAMLAQTFATYENPDRA